MRLAHSKESNEMIEHTPQTYAVFPFVAALVLVALAAAAVIRSRITDRPLSPIETLRVLPIAILLLLVGVLCALGMCTIGGWDMVRYALLLEVLGAASIAYIYWSRRAEDTGRTVRPLHIVRDIGALAVAAAASVWSLERAWNQNMVNVSIYAIAISFALVFFVMLALYFIGQRRFALPIVVVVACTGMGLAQHFVLAFKNAAILPSDVLAIGTAAAVSGGYTYEISLDIVEALGAAGVAFFALSLIHPIKTNGRRELAIHTAANLCAGALIIVLISNVFSSVKVEQLLGFTYDHWMPINSYRTYGFIPGFIAVTQDLPIPEPENYTDESAEQAQAELVASYDASTGSSPDRVAAEQQFEQVKPAIIAVMNESFSDLSLYEGLKAAGYNGPQFYNSLTDTLERGTLVSSVYGGGTANTEFEFLTGNSISFVGYGKTPYQLYDLSSVDSLPKQLAELGYTSYAIHPQLATNWNRSTVYRQMGFEEFFAGEEFEDSETYHSGASDRSTYDKILELLRENDEPQFIFDVTIQNHGGYDPTNMPAEDIVHYSPAGVTDQATLDQLAVYLGCIEASDRDLNYFIDQLRQLDRPVILLFFGDHQPGITAQINDALYPNEDPTAHNWRIYETNYFIWANYDVAGNTQTNAVSELGANALAAQLLNMAGAPLTDYQKATLASRTGIVSMSGVGYRGVDGQVYALESDSPYRTLEDDLQAIQYLNFARKIN